MPSLLEMLLGGGAPSIGGISPDMANRERQKIAIANDRLDAVGSPWLTNPFTATMMALGEQLGLAPPREGASKKASGGTGDRAAKASAMSDAIRLLAPDRPMPSGPISLSPDRPMPDGPISLAPDRPMPRGAIPADDALPPTDYASLRVEQAFAPPAKGDRVGGSIRIGGILPEQTAEALQPEQADERVQPIPARRGKGPNRTQGAEGGAGLDWSASPIMRAVLGLSGPDTASLGGAFPDAPKQPTADEAKAAMANYRDPSTIDLTATAGIDQPGRPGEIRKGPDGKNYQFAQVDGMAGGRAHFGWIPTSMSPSSNGSGSGTDWRDVLQSLAMGVALADPYGRNNGMVSNMMQQKEKRRSQNQTAQWLIKRGLSEEDALAAADNPSLMSFLLKPGAIDEYRQRATAAQEYGLDPSSKEGRNFILSGKLPDARGNDDFKVVGNQLVRVGADGQITNVTPASTANVNGSSIQIDTLPQVGITADGVVDQNAQKEFLKQLPPSIASQVEGISDGRIDINKVTSLRGGERQELAKIVSLYDPTWDMSQNTARTATRRDYATGEMAKLAASTNLAIQHMGGMVGEHAKLNNTSYPFWNTIANEFSTQTGGAAQKAFETYRLGVADELAKAFKGTGALNKEEVEAWKNAISTSSSPEQLKSAVLSAMHMLAARTETYNQRYRNVMGRDAPGFLTPESAKTLQKLGIDPGELDPRYAGSNGGGADAPEGAPNAPAGTSGPARPTTQAEFDALPSGSLYIDPDDNKPYRKP